MTEQELKNALDPQKSPTLIGHDNMTDSAFWPLSYSETDSHYVLDGLWYNLSLGGFYPGNSERFARESIRIQKDHLDKWNVKKEIKG